MKIKKLLAGLLTVVAANVCHAYDIEVDGIRYNIIDGKHLAVTYRGEFTPKTIAYITDNDYAGDIIVPDSVDVGSGVLMAVKEVDNHAFMDCSELHYVKLPPTIEKIGYLTFCRSSIEILDISDTKVVRTGRGMCAYCSNLSQVFLPEQLQIISTSTFVGTNIEEMTLHDNITHIESECFQWSNIRILTLGKGIYSIGGSVFTGSKIEQINNMELVQHYAYKALSDAFSLRNIVIGANVCMIDYSFSDMPNLESVICLKTNPEELPFTASDYFMASNPDCVLWVPDESLAAYRESAKWTCFFHDIRPLSQVKLEEATAADSTAMTLYDLNGRRVSDPRPGQICITSDGRKVRF